jgi:acyl dehydratase
MSDIPTVGIGFYWNDLKLGQKFQTVGRTVTEADIVLFVGVSGMAEVLFTNVEFLAHESAIKGRVAPAALVYSLAEGLLVQSTMQGTGFAFLNMTLDVKGPTVAGDTIHVECEVVEIRPTSKGGRGLVRTMNLIKNQQGETVISYNPLRMMKGRPAKA